MWYSAVIQAQIHIGAIYNIDSFGCVSLQSSANGELLTMLCGAHGSICCQLPAIVYGVSGIKPGSLQDHLVVCGQEGPITELTIIYVATR